METMTIDEYKALQGKSGKKKATPEHDEQVALFYWAELNSNKIPSLKLLMAIPNGASYGGGGGRWNIAKRMKDEGVKKGVPDVFLPVPMMYMDENTNEIGKVSAGLWIEMKAGKNKTSDEQDWWIEQLREAGYRVEVCYSSQEAIDVITDYLDLNSNKDE
ncbi:MAG: VRR-NUC domain-containing protein [Candidatus Dojkabacteria bacterium]|nr:VRR-NUC domain-containing protein [Candidatus Dojkabacteria bacterium]